MRICSSRFAAKLGQWWPQSKRRRIVKQRGWEKRKFRKRKCIEKKRGFENEIGDWEERRQQRPSFLVLLLSPSSLLPLSCCVLNFNFVIFWRWDWDPRFDLAVSVKSGNRRCEFIEESKVSGWPSDLLRLQIFHQSESGVMRLWMEVSYGNQNPVGTAPGKKLILRGQILTRVV